MVLGQAGGWIPTCAFQTFFRGGECALSGRVGRQADRQVAGRQGPWAGTLVSACTSAPLLPLRVNPSCQLSCVTSPATPPWHHPVSSLRTSSYTNTICCIDDDCTPLAPVSVLPTPFLGSPMQTLIIRLPP
jgi:hypothetical protein